MSLSDYLKRQNLKRSQFARILGISPSHMSDICNGKRSPSLALMRKIIEITEGKITVSDLYCPEAPTRYKENKKK